MTKTLGVLVIHGMGEQGRTPRLGHDLSQPSYSKPLHKAVAKRLGARMDRLAWYEVHWAHHLQQNQDAYFERLASTIVWSKLRRFILYNLSDAASYRLTGLRDENGDPQDWVYGKIHDEVARVLAAMQSELAEDARIIILAHSLGGHVMSNYIYDLQSNKWHGTTAEPQGDLLRLKRVDRFVTFGCNIPVFLMGYDLDKVAPIADPGAGLGRSGPWWLNYYDREDVLGYPLAKIGAKYAALSSSGGLKDVVVNTRFFGLSSPWDVLPRRLTPLSHSDYWRAPDFQRRVIKLISDVV